jgi:prevent-host-death family protein
MVREKNTGRNKEKAMLSFPVAEAKSRFSEVLKLAESGKPVRITRGRKKETVALIVPPGQYKPQAERTLGSLESWGKIGFAKDWAITDKELFDA